MIPAASPGIHALAGPALPPDHLPVRWELRDRRTLTTMPAPWNWLWPSCLVVPKCP